jgi:3-phosphoshikimate 1-carboxyvinyltransferase
MTNFIVQKSTLSGSITCPKSKSQTLRAIIFAALANGKSKIFNYLPSNDTNAMINAFISLKAKIKVFPTYLEITGTNGKIDIAEDIINANNSGIIFRFLSALAALSNKYIIITGDHSIRHQRPIKPLLQALNKLYVFAISTKNDSFAPVIIKGPIKKTTTTVSGEDSQYVSALLIALSFLKKPTTLNVINPKEIPWVKLTLSWLDKFNIKYENQNFKKFKIFGNANYKGFNYKVPSDLSTLSFLLAAALITNSSLTIKDLDLDDLQGDKKLIDHLLDMGANIEIDKKNNLIKVNKDSILIGKTIDINDCIDSLPILSVIALFAKGKTTITNASSCKFKESNRIDAMYKELKKLKANIKKTNDGLIIEKSNLKPNTLYSHNDHRIAMSLTIVALAINGTTQIDNIDCIEKTYPNFLKEFKKIKANIKKI